MRRTTLSERFVRYAIFSGLLIGGTLLLEVAEAPFGALVGYIVALWALWMCFLILRKR